VIKRFLQWLALEQRQRPSGHRFFRAIPKVVFLVGSELYRMRRMSKKRRGRQVAAVCGTWLLEKDFRRLAASTMDGRQENQFEIARTTSNSQPLQLDFASELVELKEFAKTLNIGDRMRMFYFDGVLVAEKISQTQFMVLYSETMSERLH